jgi:hypothetical protein
MTRLYYTGPPDQQPKDCGGSIRSPYACACCAR